MDTVSQLHPNSSMISKFTIKSATLSCGGTITKEVSDCHVQKEGMENSIVSIGTS